ncbi:MAG TPA: hypothetical protein VMT18_12420 [Planctomycetota bacterium]|nr:hypothetical protein [Planctomycetota bacterium]
MSAIGRIFVILNLVLAAAFVGYASTSLAKGNEWKAKYETEVRAHATTQEALDADKSKLVSDLNSERSLKEAALSERDASKAEADRNASDLETARRTIADLTASVQSIEATLAGYNQTIAQVTAAKDAAVEDAREQERARVQAESERDKAVTAQRDAQDGLSASQDAIAQLERDLTASRKEASRLDSQLEQIVAMTGVPRAGISSTPPISARVLQVSYDLKPGLVALNVGSEQGVKRGMTFQVYSGSTWKGQVRVENVQPGMSSALITDMIAGQTIAQGDSAATVL